MSIPTQGPVAVSQIQSEFGGTNPVSASEYYRGGVNVPVGTNTSGIPASGAIKVSEFRGKTPFADVVYAVVGGGGAGGFGREDGGESFRGTFGQSGGNSTLSSSAFASISAIGGVGGENCKGERGTVGTSGQASFYGSGGAGGARNNNGSPAPSASYGAGGGGGGGDAGSIFDEGGCSGEGGRASTRQAGTLAVRYGNTISILVGAGAPFNNNTTDGGAGATGFANLNVDGVDSTFSTSGSFTLLI